MYMKCTVLFEIPLTLLMWANSCAPPNLLQTVDISLWIYVHYTALYTVCWESMLLFYVSLLILFILVGKVIAHFIKCYQNIEQYFNKKINNCMLWTSSILTLWYSLNVLAAWKKTSFFWNLNLVSPRRSLCDCARSRVWSTLGFQVVVFQNFSIVSHWLYKIGRKKFKAAIEVR